MERVKLDNKRILFNLLPAHVAQHFLMSNPRNMVSLLPAPPTPPAPAGVPPGVTLPSRLCLKSQSTEAGWVPSAHAQATGGAGPWEAPGIGPGREHSSLHRLQASGTHHPAEQGSLLSAQQ